MRRQPAAPATQPKAVVDTAARRPASVGGSEPVGRDLFGAAEDALEAAGMLRGAARRWPLLGDLHALGAGYAAVARGRGAWAGRQPAAWLFLYCVRGRGWCRSGGRLDAVRAGDLLVMSPGGGQEVGAGLVDPWTYYWLAAGGERLPGYVRELGVGTACPVIRTGEDLRAIALFNELMQALKPELRPEAMFHAAHILGHLLSVLVQLAAVGRRDSPGEARKVAQVIDFLSEHVGEPLRVAGLARLVNWSPDHFAAVFKRQTGCSPHAYLQLLRMHRAAEWLAGGEAPVKDIADRLGYGSPFHFSRQFKRFSGEAPSRFRLRHRGKVHVSPASGHGG